MQEGVWDSYQWEQEVAANWQEAPTVPVHPGPSTHSQHLSAPEPLEALALHAPHLHPLPIITGKYFAGRHTAKQQLCSSISTRAPVAHSYPADKA